MCLCLLINQFCIGFNGSAVASLNILDLLEVGQLHLLLLFLILKFFFLCLHPVLLQLCPVITLDFLDFFLLETILYLFWFMADVLALMTIKPISQIVWVMHQELIQVHSRCLEYAVVAGHFEPFHYRLIVKFAADFIFEITFYILENLSHLLALLFWVV